MADMAKRTQEWRDSNPLLKWRTGKNLTQEQVSAQLDLAALRIKEIEIGGGPTEAEWAIITAGTGITQDAWNGWVAAQPHVQVLPPQDRG